MKWFQKMVRSRLYLPLCGALAVLSLCYTAFALRDMMQESTVGMRYYMKTEPRTPEKQYIPDIPTQPSTEQEVIWQDWIEVETFTESEQIALPEAAPEQEVTEHSTQDVAGQETTQTQTQTQKPAQKPQQTSKPQTQTQKPTQSTTQKPQQSTQGSQGSATKPVSVWSVTYAQAKQMVRADSAYDYEDLYWLARIISAEAKGESFTGQIGVGTVVLNRVRSREFPNTVKGVVFDTKYGTQFTPVANGTVYQAPTQSAIVAAKMCLDGYVLSDSVLYFLNPSIATSSWIQNHRKYAFRIGNHEFYH